MGVQPALGWDSCTARYTVRFPKTAHQWGREDVSGDPLDLIAALTRPQCVPFSVSRVFLGFFPNGKVRLHCLW